QIVYLFSVLICLVSWSAFCCSSSFKVSIQRLDLDSCSVSSIGVSSCFFFPKGFSSKSSIFDLFGSLIRTLSCRVYLFFSLIVWQHQVRNAMYPYHYPALLEGPY